MEDSRNLVGGRVCTASVQTISGQNQLKAQTSIEALHNFLNIVHAHCTHKAMQTFRSMPCIIPNDMTIYINNNAIEHQTMTRWSMANS